MGQTNLYSDITEAGSDIFDSEYQDILFQRNILAVFVISLTSLCMYLIFTRTSSAVKDISNKPEKGFINLFADDFMKNLRASPDVRMKMEGDSKVWEGKKESSKEGLSKDESRKEDDSDTDDDDVDSFMKNIRKMTAPKNEASRSQQQLSSNVQVEAFGSDINSMMDKIRAVAVGNQVTPEKAELVDGMFGLMDGMGKNFMNQFVIFNDFEQASGVLKSDFPDIKGFGTLAEKLHSLNADTSEHDTSEHDTSEHDTSEHDTSEHDTSEHDTSEHDTKN